MSDNKLNEVNGEDLDPETLHENYLKILRFAYPNEPIKKWIEDDIDYDGLYHLDIQWIFPIVQKIESLSSKEILVDFIISNGLVEIKIYKMKSVFNGYMLHYKDFYIDFDYDKIFAIYKAVIVFIDFFNDDHNKGLFESKSYRSPHDKMGRKGRSRQFPDSKSIDNLVTTVARIFGVVAEDIYNKGRKQAVVKSRQLCMAILFNDGRSLEASAYVFGKDHATVLHGNRSIMNIIDTKDKDYYEPVMKVLEKFDLIDRFNPVTKKEK